MKTQKNIPFKRKSARFTLIELLITVAIIAILAGMLLPALNSARAKAQTIACRSNAKTVAMAVMFYCDSYNGYIPLKDGNADSPYTSSSWIWALVSTGALKDGKVLVCPGLKFAGGWCWEYTNKVTTETLKNPANAWHPDYGGFAANPMVQCSFYTRRKLGDFKNTSAKLMFADSRTDEYSGGKAGAAKELSIDTNSSGAKRWIYGWHAQTANLAFFDGHVEGIRGKTTDRTVFADSIYSLPRFKFITDKSKAAETVWMLF